MSNNEEVYYIRELNMDIVAPPTSKVNDPDQGGAKLVFIGKPGTGKSVMMKSVLYEKSHIIAAGAVQSGTEDSNRFFEKIFPRIVISEDLDLDKMEDWQTRQKFARDHIPECPWAAYILDDVTDDVPSLKKKIIQKFYKNGRHWKMLFFLSLQYALDVLPGIRVAIDGTFILREMNVNIRKSIYENYAGVIPTYKLFCEIMNEITDDYTALYIHNNVQSNKFEDCVFYYRAKKVPEDFVVGCYEFHQYNKDRVRKKKEYIGEPGKCPPLFRYPDPGNGKVGDIVIDI